jgi:hypothetical protein
VSRPVRVVAISVRGAALTGAWMGAVPGVFLGAIVGAIISWLAAAIIQWQEHLAFTLGVAANLLPFGDQLGVLQTVTDDWWLAIPFAALAGAIAGAIWGAFVGAILAALYGRFPAARLVWLRVEPERAIAAKRSRPMGGGRRSGQRASEEDSPQPPE